MPLYDYQVRGALFLACRGRSILGDDMGLGKTIQTIAAVELLARERGIQRALVVAPASVKYQWEAEIRRFTARPVQVIDGGPEARLDQYAAPTFYRLVNYEQVDDDVDGHIGDAAYVGVTVRGSFQPNTVINDARQRWLFRMVHSPAPLQEKMALLWHHHFATAYSKIAGTYGAVDGTRSNEMATLWGVRYLGWNVKWVIGYRGTNDLMYALERREIDMRCGTHLKTYKALRPDWVRDRKICGPRGSRRTWPARSAPTCPSASSPS